MNGPLSGSEGSFVDGSTTDWIDERPTVNNALSNLRTWYNGTILWPTNSLGENSVGYTDGSVANADPASSWVDMTNPSAASVTAPLTGTGSGVWTNHWQSCSGSTPVLYATETLWQGQSLWSSNGAYQLILQNDGNLVEYGPNGALWATNTSGSGEVLTQQTDGNLVIYNCCGAIWASGSGGHASSEFLTELQDDANLVTYWPDGVPIWANNV